MKHLKFANMYVVGYLFLQFICGIPGAIATSSSSSFSREVATHPGRRFSHLVYSPATNYLYVGGVNRISQLKNTTLDEVVSHKTGPREDHHYCRYDNRNCQDECKINGIPRRLCQPLQTNAVVRGMTHDSQFLYVCYNLKLGFCERLHLRNIARVNSSSTHLSVVCADPETEVKMLIGDHPSSRHLRALYMSVSKCNGSYGYQNQVPTLSTRKLKTFDLVQSSEHKNEWLTRESVLDIKGEQAGYFKMFFRHIFSYNQLVPRRRSASSSDDGGRSRRRFTRFTYHLVVQPETSGGTIWLTRLGRVCQRDTFYSSYIELTLRCTGYTRNRPVDYNIAQAANLSRAGAHLARQLGIKPDDEVLYVAFRSTMHNQGLQRTNQGAVCVYSMAEIQRTYVTILNHCLRDGMQNIGPPHYREVNSCTKLYSQESLDQINEGYCSKDRTNTPLTGIGKSESVVKRAMVEFEDTEVDSILGGPVSDNFTVALLGTHDGRLLQYELKYSKSMQPSPRRLDDLRLGRKPITQLVRSEEERFVYALSEDKVSKVQLFSCRHYRTCRACQSARNPYCGWCILSGRCETKRVCTKEKRDYWLPYSAGVQCPRVRRLEPPGVQVNSQEPNAVIGLRMSLENVPLRLLQNCTSPCQRLCVFADDGMAQVAAEKALRRKPGDVVSRYPKDGRFAMKTANVKVLGAAYFVSCLTPTLSLMPKIPPRSDHVAVRVSLVVAGQSILFSRFYVYDCSRYKTCSSCVNSTFRCDWCIRENACIARVLSDKRCERAEIVSHKKDLECPRFTRTPEISRRPSGKSFGRLRLVVLPSLRSYESIMTTFHCVISCPGLAPTVTRTHSDYERSTIDCNPFTIYYRGRQGRLRCRLGLQWTDPRSLMQGRNVVRYMENFNNATVEVYKCQHMVENCGQCLLELSPVYDCGWCSRSRTCTLRDSCQSYLWLNRSEICTNPVITEVIPLNATLRSNVNVTIRGMNLGRTYADVKDNVILRLPTLRRPMVCHTVAEGYLPGKQLRCEIKPEPWWDAVNGTFQVRVAGKYIARSAQVFAFLQPVVHSLSPNIGPLSGGTRICLRGNNLAIGSRRAVIWRFTQPSIGDQLTCPIYSASNRHICCTTARSRHAGKVMLHLSFDKNLVSPSTGTAQATFSYEQDPEVHRVSRRASIYSGGLTLSVTGTNLHVASSARLVFSARGLNFSSRCRCNTTIMLCVTPNVTALLGASQASARSRGRRQAVLDSVLAPATRAPGAASAHLQVAYGFAMDGVAQLLNRGKFSIFPDPEVFPFHDGRELRTVSKADADAGRGARRAGATPEDSLRLKGRHLSGAISKRDIRVTVGNAACTVVTLNPDSLICMLPRPTAALHARVRVRVGLNLPFDVGDLVYEAESPLSQKMLFIILAAAVFLVFMVVVCIVLGVYRCHSRVRHRMQRKMDQLLNNMEMKVANECKDAFAELQTDMSEVTHALALASHNGYTRLPYRTYSHFCMQQLFPNQDHSVHPVLLRLEIPRANYTDFDIGFRRLSDLLKNRNFVVVVVRALEAQSTFVARDRSNFASLLSAALQSKMEYFTDLLKILLKDLISHSVERRKEKLLFRRSESVAEKMLANWLTFLLYDYLLDRAGEPLYLLTQALWLQMSRGPVDAVTYESRYALSDEKLLRETVDCLEVRLIVSDPCGIFESTRSNDQEWELPVKVLDCDTISQVKEKILFAVYRHNAYSSRPSADDIEIELTEPTTEHPEKARLNAQRRVMQDIDATCEINRNSATRTPLRRLNTLRHYMRLWNFKTGAFVKCSLKTGQFETSSFKANENSSLVNSTMNLIGTASEHTDTISGNATMPATLGHSSSYGHFPNNIRLHDDTSSHMTNFHLVKPSLEDQREEASGRTSKIVSEVLLNRLLVTKNCIQRYIDDFLRTVFAVAPDAAGSNAGDMILPLCIKYIFDFLDDEALNHNIADPEVIHVWKSNCLPLRFWVGVVKNPDCIFDLCKTPAVDSCLSVVAQTLMESCNWSKTQLSKESPSSKLLFARDMDPYRELVVNYYKDIKSIPAISDQEMNAHLIAHSNKHSNDFNGSSAFHSLYVKYICRYRKQIEEALEADDTAKRQHLAANLREVHHYLDQQQAVTC